MAVPIELVGLTKYFGVTHAVGPIALSIAEGEFVSLLGPSGCGKTTTLRMIAGFEEPSAGGIRIAGQEVARVPVENRGIGMVFQSYALFPHLSISENVAFGLRLRGVSRDKLRTRVARALDMVGLSGFAERLPKQLSGGQQQRAALARALVIEPSVLLLDEPLSNLDLKLREQMRDEIRDIQRRLEITAVYVTHDQGEAMAMSDRVAVMNKGLVEQIATPREIYEEPRTLFVAQFIGQCNVIHGEIVDSEGAQARFRTIGGNVFILPSERVASCGAHAVVLVTRPEGIRFVEDSTAPNAFAAKVSDVVYLGERASITLELKVNGRAAIDRLVVNRAMERGDRLPTRGEIVHIAVPADQCILIDEAAAPAHA